MSVKCGLSHKPSRVGNAFLPTVYSADLFRVGTDNMCPPYRLEELVSRGSQLKKESPNILIKILGLKEKNQPVTKGEARLI